MNKRCKFCNNKYSFTIKAYNYCEAKKFGYFYKCDSCKIIIQPKLIKNLYDNQDSTNYNLNKNFFFFLKQIILLNFIISIKKFFYRKKNILDYGCGSGELAIALSYYYKNKNIFTADVYDIDKKFIPKIKKHYLLQKKELKNKKFDIIIMRHVFEHIFNLNEFINQIKKNLKNKNSNLIIEVPNLESFWRKIMKERWPGYFYPFHYYIFSKQFLIKYFSKKGFKVSQQKNLEPPIIGSYLLTFGINKSICKMLSIILYPIQFLLSKFFFRSEAILLILKKR